MRVDRHDDAETGHQHYQRRTPVTDQRQRYANYRQNATDHTDVNKDINEQNQHQAADHDAAKGGLRLGGDHQPADDHQQVKRQQHQHPDQPQLFGQDGEDKVGMALRQKLQL